MTSHQLANCAAVTGNAQSPTVDSRVGGTSNAEVDDDRRHCQPGILATGFYLSPDTSEHTPLLSC